MVVREAADKGAADYVSREAFDKYLVANPHNQSRFFYPMSEGAWQDPETGELVAEDALVVALRDPENHRAQQKQRLSID